MAIINRKGLSSDLVESKLLPGEIAVTTDTGKLCYCYSAGNVKYPATIEELQALLESSAEAYSAIQQAIADLEASPSTVTSLLNTQTDIENAKNGEPTLKAKMDAVDSQLAQISSDESFENNHFESNMSSYLGLKNTGDTSNNGTRLYIIPKDHVTTGVGGTIKIFADDFYTDSINYRDMGLYFSADQGGDTGHNGGGCFYLNGKVFGDYAYLNPDIVFSFQDGADIAGRFVRIINAGHTASRAAFVFGEGQAALTLLDETMVAEFQGNIGLKNGSGFYAINADGNALNGALYYTSANKWRIQGIAGVETYIANVQKVDQTEFSSLFKHAVILNTQTTYSGTETSLSALGINNMEMNQSAPTTVTAISNGTQGQEITLYFKNGNTTIQQGTYIHLAGGANFVGTQYDTLTLLYTSNAWVEKCRSVN